MNDVIFTQGQLALFFQNEISRPDKLAYMLTDGIKEFSDCIPLTSMNPIINNKEQTAYSFQPLVAMSATGLMINITNSRIDLYSIKNSDSDDAKKRLEDIGELFIKSVDFKISRIGLVVTYFSNNIDTDKYIIDNYIKPEYKNTTSLSLRYNKISKYKNHKVNNYYTIYNGILNNTINGTYFIQDTNTDSEEKKLPSDFMVAFYKRFIGLKLIEK